MIDEQVRVKERDFRGKSLEELKKMDIREFSKFITARERRTILKNFNLIEDFIKKCEVKTVRNKLIKTHKRWIVIMPAFIDKTIHVYNGNSFVPVKITQEMLGHRLGEFALTRKPVKHGAAGVGATKSSSALSVK